MKLNFRSVEADGSLTHGVTPLLIPSTSTDALLSPSSSTTALRAVPRSTRLCPGDDTSRSEQAPVRPLQQRCHRSLGTSCLYLVCFAVLLSLPFALPAAITQAMRVIEGSHSFGSTLDYTQTGPTFTQNRGHAHKAVEQQGKRVYRRAPDMYSSGNAIHSDGSATRRRGDDGNWHRPSPGARPVSASSLHRFDGEEVINSEPLHHEKESDKKFVRMTNPPESYHNHLDSPAERSPDSNSHARARPALQTSEEWAKHAVVRNGNLYMSETFEARLNHKAALKIAQQYPHLFSGKHCNEKPEIFFSFKSSPRLETDLDIVTLCGPSGETCTLRRHVDDLRKLRISVGSGQRRAHYITADAAEKGALMSWGPLAGPLHIRLLTNSVLALRRVCPDDFASTIKLLTVGQVKHLLRRIDENAGTVKGNGETLSRSPTFEFDVFVYNAVSHPRKRARDEDMESRAMVTARGTHLIEDAKSVPTSLRTHRLPDAHGRGGDDSAEGVSVRSSDAAVIRSLQSSFQVPRPEPRYEKASLTYPPLKKANPDDVEGPGHGRWAGRVGRRGKSASAGTDVGRRVGSAHVIGSHEGSEQVDARVMRERDPRDKEQRTRDPVRNKAVSSGWGYIKRR